MYRQSIGKSMYYIDMKKTIVILIAYFDIDNLKDIEEYKTRWKIKEEKLNIELTNVFELDIIEMSKAEKMLKAGILKESNSQKAWLEFLINPYSKEESKMENMSEEMKKAYEIWQNMNLSEEEREVAERRYKDLAALEYAKEYEFKQGEFSGKIKEKEEIAKKMLEKNMDIEIIMEITGLTKEEIEKLK